MDISGAAKTAVDLTENTAKAASDVAGTAVKAVESGVRAVWSMLDAPSKKMEAAKVLTPQGKNALQDLNPGEKA